MRIPSRTSPQARRRTPPNPYSRPRSGMTLIEILIVIIILGILASITIFAVGAYSDRGSNGPMNTDPRSGWVHVAHRLDKKCDGPTMIYRNTWDDTYRFVPNSPECAE